MTLVFSSIEAAGDFERERVVLLAAEDCDIGCYAIFSARLSKDGTSPVSGPVPDAYWFRDKSVKKGDVIVLYTKHGDFSTKINDNGAKSTFFYWRKRSPVWLTGTACVVLRADTWTTGRLFSGVNTEVD